VAAECAQGGRAYSRIGILGGQALELSPRGGVFGEARADTQGAQANVDPRMPECALQRVSRAGIGLDRRDAERLRQSLQIGAVAAGKADEQRASSMLALGRNPTGETT
jgi:hypothetical protein